MNPSTQTNNPFNQWKRNLILLLVIQVLLVMGLFAWHKHHQPKLEAKQLLDFSVSDVDRLIIHDASNHVSLKKSGTEWLLPDMNSLPVDVKKLDDLLDKFKNTKLTWPVTTTASSHERFEVSADKFQRRVEFYQGDKKLGELLLGSSPGFKKIHVRREGENEVYAAELTSFEFSTTGKEWFDKALLAVKNPSLISGKDYALQKQGDNWSFENDAATKVDAAKATSLASAFAGLSVQDLVTAKPEGELTAIKVKSDAGEHEYAFIHAGDNYYVKRDDKDEYFTLSQNEFDQIIKYQRAQLVSNETSQTSSTASSTSN